MLKQLTNALKRRLSPRVARMIEVGYLNDELQRTNTGTHQILNFIEEQFEKEFDKYIEKLYKEKKEAEKDED